MYVPAVKVFPKPGRPWRRNIRPLPFPSREIEEKLRLIEPRRNVLKELNEEIENSWQFDDDSVTIGCWKYAGSVALICSVLVGGGLAVGFTVGTGIEGVDPFNITVFCWAFAAFILVIAKSARVRKWPWQDFLRGRGNGQGTAGRAWVAAAGREIDGPTD
jgi:hypothetical protein